ncbi:MAG: hypothetical protein DMD37_11805 [Gemmatimonadetes bacterium]|nr:MAG: hypothetical protein DMD37_11805 [Gemmatimonadota bacterium]
MIDAFLIAHPFVVVAVWAALYTSDYYLTLWGARLYKETVSTYIDFDGSYELEQVFKKDIDALRWISPEWVYQLGLSSSVLMFCWLLTVRILEVPELFLVVVGAYVLLEAVVHTRHVSNVVLFRTLKTRGAVEGRIKYARWVTDRVSKAQVLAFALVFIVCFAISAKIIFLGGALGCLLNTLRLARQARRRRMTATSITPTPHS